jgi:hypothetical protein
MLNSWIYCAKNPRQSGPALQVISWFIRPVFQ